MNKKYLLLIGIIIIGSVGAFLYINSARNKHPHYSVRMNSVLAKQTIITLDSNGFTPKQVTVKKSTAVRWVNKSGKQQTVNSDTYPTNQLHKELNFGVFNNNSSVTYIFAKPGTYGYHNQLHPDQKGRVIVTE